MVLEDFLNGKRDRNVVIQRLESQKYAARKGEFSGSTLNSITDGLIASEQHESNYALHSSSTNKKTSTKSKKLYTVSFK